MKNHKPFPLISVITPCFNAEQFIEQTIRSVIGQSYKNIEYIIVDGLSTDSTLNIINKYSHYINKVISEKDKGMYDAINKGLKFCNGDIICYLNSDDVFPAETLQNVVEVFNTNLDAEIVYGDLTYIDSDNMVIKKFIYPKFNYKYFISLWFSSIPQPSTFWSSNVLKEIGYFDTSFKMCGDFDYFARVGQKFNLTYSNTINVLHRRHKDTLTSQSVKINKEELKLIKKKYNHYNVILKYIYMLFGYLTFKISIK
jgi:glycosyltransferase involved in cell wall biosynthesis